MRMEQRQHIEQPVHGIELPAPRPHYGPTGRRCAVRGTIFGRDAVPDVNRMKASSAVPAQTLR